VWILKNHNVRNQKISLLIILLLTASGCKTINLSAMPRQSAGRYARISPLALDKNLTPEQLDKMFVPLENVPFEEIVLPEEPLRLPAHPAPPDIADPNDTHIATGRKAALRARYLLNKAQGTFRQNLREQAVDELHIGLAGDPNSSVLYELLSEACFALGSDTTAIAASAKAIELNSNSLTGYYMLANIKLDQRQYPQAASLLKRALACPQATESNPTTAVLHLQLAAALTEMGYLTAATQAYHETWRLLLQQRIYAQANIIVAQLVGRMHIPLLALADLQLTMGHIDSAVELLRQAQSALPNDQDLIEVFVISTAKKKAPLQLRYHQVSALCRYLLATDPQPETVLTTFYEACTHMAEYNSYLQQLDDWHKGHDGKQITDRLYAYGLALAGENSRAEQVLRNILPHDPDIELVRRDLISLYTKTRQWLQLWRMQPRDPQSLLRCLENMRLNGKAREALSLLIDGASQDQWQMDPAPVRILQNEALLLFIITRQYTQAVDLFDKWFKIVSENNRDDDAAPVLEVVQTATENLVWALTQAGFYDRAVQHIKNSYQRYPTMQLPTAIWLVQTLNVRCHFAQSQTLLEELIQLRPDELLLRTLLYLTIFEQGRKDEAITRASSWLAEKPDDPKRVEVLTLLLKRSGNYESAAAELRKHLSTVGQNDAIQLQLVDILIDADAYSQAQDILSQHDKSALWLNAWIKFDIAACKPQRALARVDEFVGPDGNTVAIRMLKANILDACGQRTQALELQKNIVEQNPDNSQSRLQYSIFLDRMGQKPQAADQLELLLVKTPDNAGIKNNLGFLLVQSHRQVDRAGQLLWEALLDDPESIPTLDSLGWFYYKKGEFDTAWEYICQAAALTMTPDPEIMDHLGDTAYRLGRHQSAQWYWLQAMDQLHRRVKTERYLEESASAIKTKLQQLNQGKKVTVASLFDETPDGKE